MKINHQLFFKSLVINKMPYLTLFHLLSLEELLLFFVSM